MSQSRNLAARQMFAPHRLTLAREFKGWTKVQLGTAAGVTGAAIGQFENTVTPSSQTIGRLAAALDVPVEFFAAGIDSGTEVGAYFRSLRSTTLTQRRKARAYVQFVHQLLSAIEQIVRLPECQVERHPIDPRSEDWAVIEAAATATRQAWGLDAHSPVPNVVRLLEQHGILVVRNYQGDPKVDAFSVPFHDRSLVVLSAEKGKHDRSRFDASHEAGHLVMHAPDQEATKHVEAQAHRFAGAFLMPATGVADELPTSDSDMRHLLDLKQKWGASIAAILRRSRDLGRMTPEAYTNAMKALSARGWRKNEPGSLRPEEPALLRRAVEVAITDREVDLDTLAELASLTPTFITEMIDQATDLRRPVTL